MLQDEIDRIRLTIEEAMVDAPASALLFKTGRVSLDELMQFLDIGSDVDNPESVLIREEENARYERIVQVVKADPVLEPMLAVVTPTLEFGGIAGNSAAGVSRTVYVSGVVVEDQGAVGCVFLALTVALVPKPDDDVSVVTP